MNCQTCHTPTNDGITLCHHCTHTLHQTLNNTPDALHTAQTTINKQATTLNDHTHTPGGKSTPPINLHALETATTLTTTITTWANIIHTTDPDQTLNNVEPTTYLTMSLPLIQTHPQAGLLHKDITTALRDLWHAIDHRPDNRIYGNCQCGGTIIGQIGNTLPRCQECGETYLSTQIINDRADEAINHPVPLPHIVRAIEASGANISRRTVYYWASNGKVAPAGKDETGRNLYTVAAFLEALR